MEAVIGGDQVSQTLKVDLISSYYGSMDGYSFCIGQGLFSINFLPATLDTWIVIQDNVITIQSMTASDPEDSETITVQVLDENNDPLIGDRTFTVALVTTPTPSTQQLVLPGAEDGEASQTPATEEGEETPGTQDGDDQSGKTREAPREPTVERSPLTTVTPVVDECYRGGELSNQKIDVWHVPY